MVKYNHDISNNHKLTTILDIYIFITDMATPERKTTAIRKTTLGTYLLYLLIITVIIINIMLTTASVDRYETKSVNRLNYGIYFKHVDTIEIMNDNLLTTVKIPLPQKEQLSNRASRRCSAHSAQNERAKIACYQHLQFWHFLNALHEHAECRMQTLLDTITTLIPSPLDLQRDRRIIASFIGNFIRSLIGTATLDDIMILQNHIVQLSKEIKNVQMTLRRQGEHLSSYIQLNNKRIDNLVTMIKQQQNDTDNLLTNMAFDRQVQITAISQRIQLLFKSTNTIAHLQSQLDNLLAAVETLTAGTLTSYIIPQTTLQTIIDHVSQTLRDHGNTLHLIYKHPTHYYTDANFICWRQHNNLFIIFKLPLSAYDILF